MISTLFGGMTVAAAIDSGQLPEPRDGDRVLLVSNNASAPELVTPWHEVPAASGIVSRFDRVIYLNDDLYPYHPSRWRPEDPELPLLERALRSHWGLNPGPIELLADSLQSPPAATLSQVFWDGPITVLSEGLMSYGPTRRGMLPAISHRLQTLLYLDILPGVNPVLLQEFDVDRARVSLEAFRAVVCDMVEQVRSGVDALPDYSDKPTSLVLGQYLASLEIVSTEEETRLCRDMVDAAVEHGAQRVVYKPHPSAYPAQAELIRREAEELGVEFEILEASVLPAEMIAAATPLDSIVSCFSTALLTINSLYGVHPIAVGSELLLERISPYQNSNRIPATIVHALTHSPELYGRPEQLQELIEAVAYCMQSLARPDLRSATQSYLETLPDAERQTYFKKRRLGQLGLPGGSEDMTPEQTAQAERERRKKGSLSWRLARKAHRLLRGAPGPQSQD